MPLLVGLADASEVRRNPDLPLHTLSNGRTGAALVNGRVVYDDEDPVERVDLAELAARQHKGGNMMDSMFNMANSILGAGEFLRCGCELRSRCYAIQRIVLENMLTRHHDTQVSLVRLVHATAFIILTRVPHISHSLN